MAYNTLDATNATGIDSLIVYVTTAVPSFTILFLICFALIIFISTYFGSRKLTGQADIIASFSAAAFTNLILVVLLKLQAGLLTDIVFYISLAAAIVGVMLLLLAPKMRN